MKIKNFTAFVCMLFVAQLSFGQITFEKTYKDAIYTIGRQGIGDSGVKYYLFDRDAGSFTIYNLDHSVYKVITPEVPSGARLDEIDHLFINAINSDPLIELYYTLEYENPDSESVYETYLINENEELIEKFENVRQLFTLNTDEGFKLWASRRTIEGKSEYDIYFLPTTLNSVPSLKTESASLPYPNPAKQTITIPYQLSSQWGTISIYNASGQFIEQKSVDKNFNSLLLDVSDYVKGMYYYKVDKQKGEFMVN